MREHAVASAATVGSMSRTPLTRLLICSLVCTAVSIVPIVETAEATPSPGALVPSLTLQLDTLALPDVPIDAVGLALNVTVTDPAAAGYLTVYPCASGRPLASNLNYRADQTVPNFVISAIDPDGYVCIDTLSTTDVVVDLAGYVPAGSPLVMLAAPARFADTREAGDAGGIRLRAGEVRAVPIAGRLGVAADASAVVFNATAVNPDRAGFLTVFPCGRPVPRTSTLNFTPGTVVPNLVTSAVGSNGSVCFYAIADVDIVADVAAYVPASGAGVALLDAPQRIFDTRDGTGGATGRIGSSSRVQVTGVAGVPAGALAAIVNLTATESTLAGYVTAWPCDQPRPLASNLNFLAGQNVANFALVHLAADGSLCLASNTAVHGIVDIAGYVTSSAAYVPLSPSRIADTRDDADAICDLGVTEIANGARSWVSVATGQVGPSITGGPATPGTYARGIGRDCQSAWFVNGSTAWQVDRTGAIVATYTLPPGSFATTVFMGASGPYALAMAPSPVVYDLRTAQPVWAIPALQPASQWEFAGAAYDLSALWFFRRNGDFTRDVRVYDGDGVMIGEFTLANGSDEFRVAPGGLYMSYGFKAGGLTAPSFDETVIVTFAGDVVERRPVVLGGQIRSHLLLWQSDGRALTCTNSLDLKRPRLARANLFAPTTELPALPCLAVAG